MSKKKKTNSAKNQQSKPAQVETKLQESIRKDADYKAVKREFDEKKREQEKAERKAEKRKNALSAAAVALVAGLLVGGGAWAINKGAGTAEVSKSSGKAVPSVEEAPLFAEAEEKNEPIYTACFTMAGEHFDYEVFDGDDISADAIRANMAQYEKTGKDAEIVFNQSTDSYEIVPEELDININYDNFASFVKFDMEGGLKEKDYTDTKHIIYTTVVTADELSEECDTLNDDYHYGTVTYYWDGVSDEETREYLTVTGAMKKAWSLPEGGYNEDAVAEWVASVAERYDTWKKPKKFITHDNREVYLADSSYGWEINQQKSVKELLAVLDNKENQVMDFSYSHEAYGHENGVDYGKTYVEVDILGQHVYYYKDGELKMDSDCVTGDAKRKRDTDPGAWAIFYMQKSRVLRGPGYASFVYYWMNFNHGEGLHDATWRKAEEFGGETYKGNGSHGCVNLPKEWAAQMYEEAYVGMPVVVYAE